MRICAALCWFDESAEFLTRCVSSLEGLVDAIVAVDGAWELFDGRAWSPDLQQWAIKTAAFKAGIGCEVIVPPQRWRSQVEKRAKAMEAAGDGSDWVFVIDADEYVEAVDVQTVRAELEHSALHVAEVTHRNLDLDPSYNPDPPRAGLTRRFYREGSTVIVVHSGYVRNGEYLHASDAVDLRESVAIVHDNWNRGDARNRRSRDYRKARQREGVEVWA